MGKKWQLKTPPNSLIVDRLMSMAKKGIDRHLAEMLVSRGITEGEAAHDFFVPDLNKLHNPFLMNDMAKAVARLEFALDNNEKILVYGDYDVDGTTSVALVYSFLNEFHHNIDYYIPDRYTEGYGVSNRGVDYAFENGCSLVIALDCGIKDGPRIDYAKQKGIDFIVCDHHTPGDELPNSVAVLNLKLPHY